MPICKQPPEQRITPKKYQPQNYSLSSDSFHKKVPCRQIKSQMRSLFKNYHPLQMKIFPTIICYYYFSYFTLLFCEIQERKDLIIILTVKVLTEQHIWGWIWESQCLMKPHVRLCRFVFVVFATSLSLSVRVLDKTFPEGKDIWENFNIELDPYYLLVQPSQS